MSRPDFLIDSLDLFRGRRIAHMGLHQYSDHAGMRDGKSMSGARLWAEAEASREADYAKGLSNKAGAELETLKAAAQSITDMLPRQTNVLELGPGPLQAFRVKTLPVLQALHSTDYVMIDLSAAFLKDIKTGTKIAGLSLTAIEDDFFCAQKPYIESDAPVLVCAFGGIISNLIAPLSDSPPEALLIATLAGFAKTLARGWLLVTFDSSDDGARVSDYYRRHALFQLNIFDRMAVELPLEGAFDPKAFDYTPEWRSGAHQLGHIATVNRDLHFCLDGQAIHLEKGRRLHLKNSFKFAPAFFEYCCAQANLSVIHRWVKDEAYCLLLRTNQP